MTDKTERPEIGELSVAVPGWPGPDEPSEYEHLKAMVDENRHLSDEELVERYGAMALQVRRGE